MFYTMFSTEWGWVGLAGSAKGLKRLILPSNSSEDVMEELHTAAEDLSANDAYFRDITRQLLLYFQGHAVKFDCKLDLSGTTDFQRHVWEITSGIPYGGIRSYRWVADRLGNCHAYRAVGQALARNPIPVVIPCHRVIYEHGNLGGFGGKRNVASVKAMLLSIEGVEIGGYAEGRCKESVQS